MYEGEDFIFVSDRDPGKVIRAFIEENKLEFNQKSWEFPWAPDDAEEVEEFDRFEGILDRVLSEGHPEYIFYLSGRKSCWIGVANDRSVVFGVEYSGESADELAAYAKRYGGRFGFVSVTDFPPLDGLEWFKGMKMPVAFRSGDFVLFGEEFLE